MVIDSKSFGGVRVMVALLSLLVVVAVCMVLREAQSVIFPLIIAWLLSYILGPVVTFMKKHRVPTGIAVTLVLLMLGGIIYLGGVFIYARFMTFWKAYPDYQVRVTELLARTTEQWDLPYDPLAGVDWWATIGDYLTATANSVISFTSAMVMVMVYLIFLLLGKPYFEGKLRRAFSADRANHIGQILGSISGQIGIYLSLMLFVSAATGVGVWLGLSWIGVDFAVTWGALAFLLNFIPIIGSVLASIPPVLVALVQFPTVWTAVGTALMLLTVQMAIGNFVAPKLMGERLNLSPVVVLLSLVFWGWLWGIVGALLSVPIASTIKIVCENVEPLRPISILMGSGKGYADADQQSDAEDGTELAPEEQATS